MAQSHAALYRSVWRWHFYAGIIVAPFLLILAVTGAIYLFNDEINDVLYPELRFAAENGERVPLSRIAASAAQALPGSSVTRIDTPPLPGRTTQVFVTPREGEPVRVFVDPGTGKVLGSYKYTSTLTGFADVTHGSLMLGDFGDAVVELAACWGFILTVTGLYLWWPRGNARFYHALYPRLALRGRQFWKSIHSVVGLWSALLILFLILTGLPWATIWGDLFRQATDAAGIGYPASFRTHSAPVSASLAVRDIAENAAPWTIEAMPAPMSDPHAGHHADKLKSVPGDARSAGLDEVAAQILKQGMKDPYRLSLPQDAMGVFSAFTYPDDPQGQRTLYIDQYSAAVVGDIRFQDYGVAAKAVELGVQIHMGNYFGRVNQIVMLIPCLGIIILTITGPYMWWLRKPKQAFGVPTPIGQTSLKALALIVCILGLFFPLAGASLVLVLVLDWILRIAIPPKPASG